MTMSLCGLQTLLAIPEVEKNTSKGCTQTVARGGIAAANVSALECVCLLLIRYCACQVWEGWKTSGFRPFRSGIGNWLVIGEEALRRCTYSTHFIQDLRRQNRENVAEDSVDCRLRSREEGKLVSRAAGVNVWEEGLACKADAERVHVVLAPFAQFEGLIVNLNLCPGPGTAITAAAAPTLLPPRLPCLVISPIM